MIQESIPTNTKALDINLDLSRYGTFAEIGAGQEVARHFFQAGGAAGTIAKSMSAYDMKFSDDIYGKTKRYVSQERLEKMLEHEYALLVDRLRETRGSETLFFAYANTVVAQGYKKRAECHGWMGLRFEHTSRLGYNDVMIHVRLLDDSNVEQQDALGIVGVNLLYACFYYCKDHDLFVKSLMDNLSSKRIEVDMISVSGPDFVDVDNRVVSLKLVENNLTQAVLFNAAGQVVQPSEVFYKKPILVERGSFRPVTHVNVDMMRSAGAQFIQEEGVSGEAVISVMELTMTNLSGEQAGPFKIDTNDFLSRVETINSLGYYTLISNYFEYYRLSNYFQRYTKEKVGVVMGINNLLNLFNGSFYEDLQGGILESFGRLFKSNIKLYIYPMSGTSYNKYRQLTLDHPGSYMPEQIIDSEGEIMITAKNVQVGVHLRNLYAHLIENHYIEPIIGYDPEAKSINSREIFAKIKAGDNSWEAFVPISVAKAIRERKLWGYIG